MLASPHMYQSTEQLVSAKKPLHFDAADFEHDRFQGGENE
jgi:hypothetical protein